MSQINLNVDLSTLTGDQVRALSNFVSSFGEYAPAEDVAHSIPESVQEEPAKKTRAKKNTTPQAGVFEGQERTESIVDEYKEAANLTVVDATDAQDDLMGEEAKAYTLDDVRALVSEKAANNRQAIKDKIPSYGNAANVASMGAEHYPAFIEFLNGLKQ
jgi:hypothetical protein